MSRVGEAARALGLDLDEGYAASLSETLDLVEGAVPWSPWDEATSYGRWPLRSSADAHPDVEASPSQPPRLLNDGGPYVEVFATSHRVGQGPLAGWTVAVKDLISVAGVQLRASSAVRAEAPPQSSDALVVDGLRRLGASLVGMTALHEFAFGVTGVNRHTGTPPNPRAPGRIPGGSSSGSAVAVAEGSARIALGTDTGGSIRIPAALCGVVGYKPSFGLYPTAGVFPLAPTLDHVGLLARSVDDVRRVHSALGFPLVAAAGPRRVGIVRAELEGAASEVAVPLEALIRRLESQGVEVVPVSWPDQEETFAVSTLIMFSEAAAIHRSSVTAQPGSYGEDVRDRLLQGAAVGGWAYFAALRLRELLREQTMSVLAHVDCVLGPTVGITAPPVEEVTSPSVAARLVQFTRLANVTGVPALSIPLPGDGLPVGMQVMSADDPRLLSMGARLESMVSE